MRKLFAILITACVMTACATTNSSEKMREKEETARKVREAIDARNFTVSIDMMHALRGRSVSVTPDYCLRISGDSVYSYLPYFGRAYNIPYGGGKGLNFDATLQEYTAERDKKGRTKISFIVKNEEDTYKYRLEIFDNGNAGIHVTPQRRDQISYDGDMDLD